MTLYANFFLVSLLPTVSTGDHVFPLRMPDVIITKSEVYMCTGVEVGPEKEYWVTGFSPVMVEGTVHHLAVVGCASRLETPRNLWNCGANGNPALEPGYPALTPCHSEDNTTSTLYLWSRGGRAVTLPPDTGFPVGGASKVHYLVLQEPSRSAGMLSVHVMTNVPPLARSYQDGGCRIAERAAQTFRELSEPGLRLVEGDRVATRCTMLNMGTTRVRQGLASYHEMCDVYIMYWVEGNHTKLLQKPSHCTSMGPPSTTWQSLGFRNIPETAASTL